MTTDDLKTPFHAMHTGAGAKMVPFAGYDMPVSYPLGVLKEHQHTRARAGLFDVSHMGQVILSGPDAEQALERLMPVDVAGLAAGRQRYGLLTNDQGGVRDDLMFANTGEHIFMVVNAACKAADIAHLTENLSGDVQVHEVTDRALLALQGPEAEEVLATLVPHVREMRFMDYRELAFEGQTLFVTRSGYTGMDGFEISIPHAVACDVAQALLDHESTQWIGLGARDSLRLEAGLCLYGHELSPQISPIEAGLTWAISKSRRADGGFAGDARILDEIAHGAPRTRVGLRPHGRAPLRDGTQIYAAQDEATHIGTVTSGGFGPTVEGPISMALVDSAHRHVGTELYALLRGKWAPVTITALPFVPASFKR